MDYRTIWRRYRPSAAGGRLPLALLILIGGGSVALLVALAGRRTSVERVPLQANTKFTATQFREAQSTWKAAGLTQARLSGGVIEVPASDVDQYSRLWHPTREAAQLRTRWADAWQDANDRLSQFSGTRERESARDISRAQAVSRLLEELPDIAAADIVWDEESSRGWRQPERVRATVYLKAEPGRLIGPEVVDAVRRAVSGSKANLDPADVTVMDQSRMVAYDGSQATNASTRLAQSIATLRARLEAALQHIEGAVVQVHPSGIAGLSSDNSPAPVAVSIAIPEAAIRQLARLDDRSATGRDGSSESEQRRRVFQAVERHLQDSIRSKVAALMPVGLQLVEPRQLMVETIPSPQPEPAPRPETALAALLTAWAGQNALPVLAVLFGAGALWTVRPTRRSASTPATAIATSAATEHEAIDAGQPAAKVQSPTAARDTEAHEPESPINGMPATASRRAKEVADADKGHSDASHSLQPTAKPMPAEADLLREVLAKLESRRGEERVHRSMNAPPAVASEDLPQILAGRVHGSRQGDHAPATLELEDLAAEQPERLQQVVQRVEPDVWSRALFGASPGLQSQLLAKLPEHEANRVTRELRAGRPVRLREIDAAQERVLSAWQEVRQNLPPAAEPSARSAPERSAA
ncbi:MAG: hypothetical protein KDA75_11815 [Planctomycetaceae bacterium]|nr:hypothetical protein [Planctomycetaceae bacterium]